MPTASMVVGSFCLLYCFLWLLRRLYQCLTRPLQICIEIADTWHSLQEASTEALQCPRCSALVHDRFGICGYCGENAHQCRQCRAINYSSLDGWLCPECGFSRYCRLDVHLLSAPSNDYMPISSEQQRATALQQVEALSEDLSRKQAVLLTHVRALGSALSAAAGSEAAAHAAAGTGSAAVSLAVAAPRLRTAVQLLDSASVTVTGGSAHAAAGSTRGSTSVVVTSSSAARPGGVTARTASQQVLQAAVTQLVERCRMAHKDVTAAARQLLGVRRALLQYLHKPPPGSGCDGSSMQARLYTAMLSMDTMPAMLHPSGCAYVSTAAAVPQLLKAMLALAQSLAAAPAALLAGGALKQVAEFDLVAPDSAVSTTACQLLLKLAGLDGSRLSRGVSHASPATGHQLRAEIPDDADQQQQQVAVASSDARNVLASALQAHLSHVLRHPGLQHDWGAVQQVVGLLVDACHADLEAVARQQQAAASSEAVPQPLTSSTPASAAKAMQQLQPASAMLAAALSVLQLALVSSGSGEQASASASASSSAIPADAAALDCCSSVAVLEVIILPMVQMLSQVLHSSHSAAMLKIVGMHLHHPPPLPQQPAASLHGQQSGGAGKQGESDLGSGTGADKAPAAQKVMSAPPPPGALNSGAAAKKKQSQGQQSKDAPIIDVPSGVHVTKQQHGSYAQQGAAQRGGQTVKGHPLLTKQQSVDNPSKDSHSKAEKGGSEKHQGGSEASGGIAAELTQMAAAAAAAAAHNLHHHQHHPPFDAVAAAPGLLQALLRPLLLAPGSRAVRTAAVQLYRELHAEADGAGRAGSAAKGGGAIIKGAGSSSRAAGAATSRPSQGSLDSGSASPAASPAAAGVTPGSGDAPSIRQPASQIKLLESLLDEKGDGALLPAALSAGGAGEEVLGVVGECVEAAAGSGSYALLARLLSLLMASLPGLVRQLLLQEGPLQACVPPVVTCTQPSTGSGPPAASAFVTHPAAASAAAGLPLVAAPPTAPSSSMVDAAGHAAIVARLMALVGRLLEFSELQGSLLAHQGRLLVQLVWCTAGLSALQLGRSAVCTSAEVRVGKLLSSRFIRGGEEMRRALIRASLAALASLHADGNGSSTGVVATNVSTSHGSSVSNASGGAPSAPLPAASTLPLAAVQRMHAALLSLVLRAANPALDKDEDEGKGAGAGGVPLLLDKAPTQEEFIPGSMGAAPYSSNEIGGPLMRHVKNFICRRLDMGGLEEDDFGMELLVAGNIIDLSLPIQGVYDQVWRPYLANGAQGPGRGRLGGRLTAALSRLAAMSVAAGSSGSSAEGGGSSGGPLLPMLVTYRLSGLDGEATEPVVKTLGEGGSGGAQAEVSGLFLLLWG